MLFEQSNTPFAGVAFRLWPVGSIYISVSPTNPAELFGFGTWVAFGAGRCLVGVDAGDSDFDAAEKTSGSKTVTLTEAQIPSHTHLTQRYPTTTGGNSGFTADTSMSGTPADNTLPVKATGGGEAHPNVQPSIAVYMWRRTT